MACCSKVCEDNGLGYGQCGKSKEQRIESEKKDDKIVEKLEKVKYGDGQKKLAAKINKAKEKAKKEKNQNATKPKQDRKTRPRKRAG